MIYLSPFTKNVEFIEKMIYICNVICLYAVDCLLG